MGVTKIFKMTELRDKILEIIDMMETEFGDLEGFEIKLEKHKDDEGRVQFSEIKEFNLYYLSKVDIAENFKKT